MTAADTYPSVTIVAGPIKPAPNPVGTFGHMLRMHNGAAYITITDEVARQWIETLTKITEEKSTNA